MKKSFVTSILTCPLMCCAAEYNFSGDFGTQFTIAEEGDGTFEQKSGRAIYHNGGFTGAGSTEVFLWNSFQPRADQSWILSADVTIPLLARRTLAIGGEDPEIHAEIGIGCIFGDNNFSAGMQQGFQSDSNKRVLISETQSDGDELFDPFPDINGVGELLTGEERVRVVVSYDSTSHVLSTTVGGIALFSVDIENSDSASGSSNQTDWGMEGGDTFKLAIFGTSENYPVDGDRPLQLDNLSFSSTGSANPSVSLTISQAALELNIENNTGNSPVEIQTSDNMSDWYTISTSFGNGRVYLPKDNGTEFFRAFRASP